MDTNLNYHESVAIIIIVINSISFLSLSFIIFIYIYKWTNISSFPLRLSFYLCISCLIQNLTVILLNPILINQYSQTQFTSGYCKFQGILKTSADLSSILWTTFIIYSVFATIVLKKKLQNVQISYLVIAYAFPLLIAIIPVFFSIYGYDTYFCWFAGPNKDVQFALKIVYFFGPLWIAFFLNVFMTTKSFKKLKNLGINDRQLIIFKRLMLFPLIMFSTQFLQTINLIYSFITDTDPQWFDLIANILSNLYGILNAIAYGLNPIIRQQIDSLFGQKQEITHQRQLSNISNILSQRSRQVDNSRFTEISDY